MAKKSEKANPKRTTSTIYARFYVGHENDKGELQGNGKFKKFKDAKAKAEQVATKEGNSWVVSPRGVALWTHDGDGLFQVGHITSEQKKFYSAESYLEAEDAHFTRWEAPENPLEVFHASREGKVRRAMKTRVSGKSKGKKRGPYVFPARKAYPIGSLSSAKSALIFSTWPNNKRDAKKVRKAVFKRYPQLRAWFEDGKYMKRAESHKGSTPMPLKPTRPSDPFPSRGKRPKRPWRSEEMSSGMGSTIINMVIFTGAAFLGLKIYDGSIQIPNIGGTEE